MTEQFDFILNSPQFEARIHYLLPEEGGRQSAFYSGYRGQFYYDCKNWDAAQQFIDKPFCEPGSTVNVLIQTASPINHYGKLFINKQFEIREGINVVGVGRITKIFFTEFQRTEIYNYEKKIIDLILRNKKINITSVHDLDGVKSIYFNQDNYPSIQELVKQGKWYLINDSKTENKNKEFGEYLYIETFSDQQGQEYVATIYDNDELWQNLELVDLFKL